VDRRAGSFIIGEWLFKTIAASDSKKQPDGKCDGAESFFEISRNDQGVEGGTAFYQGERPLGWSEADRSIEFGAGSMCSVPQSGSLTMRYINKSLVAAVLGLFSLVASAQAAYATLPGPSATAESGNCRTLTADVWVVVANYSTFSDAQLHMLLLQRRGYEAKVDYNGETYEVLILQR
jgi:hypothetical protein